MAKYCGKVGYVVTEDIGYGVWTDDQNIVERLYYGDTISNTRRLTSNDQVNENVNVTYRVSIVADPYAMENFLNMRYAEYMGVKWRVTSVDVQHPRLILTLGGVYNGGSEDSTY